MSIQLEELDVMSKVEGLDSTLIVACNMCAGASFAMKENKPFIQFFSNFLTSPPLERHIREFQSQLKEKGVKTKWVKSGIIQKFFLCLWTSRQRSKFRKYAEKYDSVKNLSSRKKKTYQIENGGHRQEELPLCAS